MKRRCDVLQKCDASYRPQPCSVSAWTSPWCQQDSLILPPGQIKDRENQKAPLDPAFKPAVSLSALRVLTDVCGPVTRDRSDMKLLPGRVSASTPPPPPPLLSPPPPLSTCPPGEERSARPDSS